MSKLYFKIGADYDKVIRLREEIAKLKQELLSMNQAINPQPFSLLEAQLRQTTQEFNRLIQQAAMASAQMQNTTININHITNGVGNLNSMLAKVGGTAALTKLASEIIRVRGEFQSMQTVIETMVGKDIAGKLIPQIKEMAKISPLTMSDMVGAEKMMLGFNIQAEDTIKFLKALSDISMGESSKFNSLTLAFSQMSATGKLMGQDLNQMINAGFNPLQQIAQTTGKSIATLKEEMSKGAISAEMVQQAFVDATSAGGKFYGMSENASKTINGQISMMQDAWDNALNEMGQSSEGFITSGIQATTSLIQNYETIGKVLVGMIATYGVYRTALIANIALTRGWAVAARADAVAKGLQTIATKAQTIAQLALNSAMKANPYVLAATLIVGMATAMWAFHDSTSAAEKAQKSFNDEQERFNKQQEDRKQKIEQLIRIIQDETETEYAKVKAYEELKTLSPAVTEAYTREKLAILELSKQQKVLNEERDKINYEEIIRQIEKYRKLIASLNGETDWNDVDLFARQEHPTGSIKNALEQDLNSLKKWEEALFKHNRIKKETEENNNPIEVRLNAAKENENNIKEALEIIDDFILTKKREIEGYEIKVPLSPEEGVRATESLEDKVKVLKSKVEGDDIKIPFKPNEYLNKIPSLFEQEKNNWVKMGLFTIPISIELERNNISELLSAVQKSVSALSGNSTQTYNEAYYAARKEWKAAQKVLEESKKKSKAEYVAAKKNLDDKEKAYKDLGGATNTAKQENKARKEAERRDKELLTLQNNNQKSQIDLMKDGSVKKIAQIELGYKNEIAAIKKQEEEWSKAQGGKLTEKQSQGISIAYTQAEDKKDKGVSDVTKEDLKAEQQALNDYLKEYGTFQQQKLAITEEYAEKIKKAQEDSGINSSQVKLLEKQRDVAIQNKETEAIKANIDWVTVFGEFGGMFNDMIKPALEEAKKYVQTDKFKNSDQASQKTLIDAINQMEKSIGGTGGMSFKKLGQEMQTYQNSLRSLNTAKNEEIDAINRLKKAKEVYEKAMKDGTDQEKQLAKDARDVAQQNADTASTNLKTQTDIVNENQQNVTNSATGLKAAMENVTGGLNKLASGGLSSAYSGIIQATNGIKDAIGKTSDSLKEVPIIGWILSIIDVFKDGLSNFVGPLLDAIFNAISGIISDIFSGDIFVTIGKSLRDGIGSIFNAISFGGWDSLMGKINGSNAKEVQETIDKLTNRNEILGKSIDRLTEVMDKTAGVKSISAYEQARQYQQEQITNTLQIAREQARYSGSHHSWQKYMEWTDEQLQWAQRNVDGNFSGTDSLWGLTPEQMRMLLSNADIYNQIEDSGKGGYGGRVMEKLEAYADNADKLDELTAKINESIAQISFDSLRDSFVDTLMDMDASAEDFANNFEEYLMKSMLNFSMGDILDDEMKKWYNDWAKTIGDQKGKLTPEQIEKYKKEWDDMVQEGIDKRNELAELTGYDSSSSSSQSSTQKGFAAMSQDSADELNGRFTALQISGEEIKSQNYLQSQSLNFLTMKSEDIFRVSTEMKDIAGETRDLIASSYLELVQISENTGAIIKPIQQMQRDMADVKKNTSGLNTK